ncbi:tetratricopeptide repeat protein [Marinilabiliaceae bacterium ANBcel2]|nr:tetratricopeptide repeat protein [Marinilabiliaceae bacterium ANBcel2]
MMFFLKPLWRRGYVRYILAAILFLFLLLIVYTTFFDNIERDYNVARYKGVEIDSRINPVSYSIDSVVVVRLLESSHGIYQSESSQSTIEDSFISEALEVAKKSGSLYLEAYIYIVLADRYFKEDLYQRAGVYYNSALHILRDSKLYDSLYLTLLNKLGNLYNFVGDYESAFDHYFDALAYSREVEDSFNEVVALSNIGDINFNIERYHSAMLYYRRSIVIASRNNKPKCLALNYYNIGNCLISLGKADSAMFYFNEALLCNKKISKDSRTNLSDLYIGKANAFITLNNSDSAIYYLNMASDINSMTDDSARIISTMLVKGKLYTEIGQYDEALDFLLQASSMALAQNIHRDRWRSLEMIASLYEKQGKYKEALAANRRSVFIKDSVITEERERYISNLETMSDVQNQRNKIVTLSQESIRQAMALNRQRAMTTAFIIFIVVILLAFGFVVYHLKLRGKYLNLKNQHKLLRTQMNPHFIFNALSSIQLYVMENDVEKSTRFLTDFAKLMRVVLKESHFDYISLENDIYILQKYLDLQQLRFYKPFQYHIYVDERLEKRKVVVPPMLTQPFVENAVEHGLRPIQGQGALHVRYKLEEQHLVIEVEDNGIGIKAAMEQKRGKGGGHDSMALKITRERLSVIRNDTGGKYVNLDVIDKKDSNPFDSGTIIKITLPAVELSNGSPNIDKKKSNIKRESWAEV